MVAYGIPRHVIADSDQIRIVNRGSVEPNLILGGAGFPGRSILELQGVEAVGRYYFVALNYMPLKHLTLS
jgi:hypothetical protein